MPSYLVMGNYTEQGVKAIKASPQRLDAAKQAAQTAGGRMIFFYLTLGPYDFAALFELPDDETAASLLLGISRQGNVRTTTLKAFTEDEYQRIIAAVP